MNDDKLKELLKEGAHKPGKNEWFTPRLLNKLPAKQHSTAWASVLATIVAIVACVAGWVLLLKGNDWRVITVRDIVYVSMLIVASAAVTWQSLRMLIMADE